MNHQPVQPAGHAHSTPLAHMQGLAQLQRQKYELQACQQSEQQRQRQLEEELQWRSQPELQQAQLPVDYSGGVRTDAGSFHGDFGAAPDASAAAPCPGAEAAGGIGTGFSAHGGIPFTVAHGADSQLERMLLGTGAGEHMGEVILDDGQAFAPSAPFLEDDYDDDGVDWGDSGPVFADFLGESRHHEGFGEPSREGPGAPQTLPATWPPAAARAASASAGDCKQENAGDHSRSILGASEPLVQQVQAPEHDSQKGPESLHRAPSHASMGASGAAKSEPLQERNGSGARPALADVVELSSSSSSSLFHSGADDDAEGAVDSKPNGNHTVSNGHMGSGGSNGTVGLPEHPGSKRRNVSQEDMAASGALGARQKARGLLAKTEDDEDVVVVGHRAGQGRQQQQAQGQALVKGEKEETKPAVTSAGPGLSPEELQQQQRVLMAQFAEQQALKQALQQALGQRQQQQQRGWHSSQQQQEQLLLQQQQQLLLQHQQKLQQQQLMLQQMGRQQSPHAQDPVAGQPGQYSFASTLNRISNSLSSGGAPFRGSRLPGAVQAGLSTERAPVPLPRSQSAPQEQEAYTSVIQGLNISDSTKEVEIQEGLLSVPLLKHQKLALGWMEQRELSYPAGGILADDQGLGKTVSTIALIVRCHHRRREQRQEKEKEEERRRAKLEPSQDTASADQSPGRARESPGATDLAEEAGAGGEGPQNGSHTGPGRDHTQGGGSADGHAGAASGSARASSPATGTGSGSGTAPGRGLNSRGASFQAAEVVNLDEDEALFVLDAPPPVNRGHGVGPGATSRAGGGPGSSGAPRERPERGAGGGGGRGKPPGAHSKRLPGGTLVVCPTSVLWQWEKELRAKLGPLCRDVSVLVYHGATRGRKTAAELADYGVVLTTYAIVALDVPRAEELRERAEEKEREREAWGGGGGRGKGGWKGKGQGGGTEKQKAKRGAAAEGARGPLANIAWHRVVLDEAQCIKNRSTQMAHSCWGLRAKRRWCLSGTPIQNSVDDIYSYFRFLRYAPYDDFAQFRKHLKDSATGVQRLQAVLRAVMLRRTKTTKIDGQPIIQLPPRIVRLCEIEFSPEERRLYQHLEASSKAQFEDLAASGSLTKHYMSILVMLLRLRQLCNHPRLLNLASLRASGFDLAALGDLAGPLELGPGGVEEGGMVGGLEGGGDAAQLPLAQRMQLLAAWEEAGGLCGICQDVDVEAPAVTGCRHAFCQQCILQHFNDADATSCPACFGPLPRTALYSVAQLRATTEQQAQNALLAGPGWNPQGAPGSHPSPHQQQQQQLQLQQQGGGSKRKASGSGHGVGASEGVGVGVSSKTKELLKLLLALPVVAPGAPQPAQGPAGGAAKGEAGEEEGAAGVGGSTGTRQGTPEQPPRTLLALPPPAAAAGDGRGGCSTGPGSCLAVAAPRAYREKAIVFSQWATMLDLVEGPLEAAGLRFVRLDGSMSCAERDQAVTRFVTSPEITVMLMSLKAASLGLNLVVARHVVLLDLWWNPSTEEQAIDRAHRIGQTKPVLVSRFAVKDTIEDRILELQARKRSMVANAFGETQDGSSSATRLTMEDLIFLFRSGEGR